MALKHYKPTTPGTRGLTQVDRSDLYRGAPEKALTVGLKSKGGRNNFGHVTVMHQGGGHKRKYRLIDFKRKKMDVPATVVRLEYDPNRTAFIALIEYTDGMRSYILAPRDLKAGDVVISAAHADIKPGNTMPLKNMPIGTIVHNVELKPGAGGQLARSAGCYAQLMGKDGVYAQIKMNSGEL
ncbi:MAG: 50S ribosomal protein L2, partial [Alphaproteobacteria bacterium]|nr:50S ribosomal protein L2 [Alphaproteobacteria bacterium]